MIDLLNAGDADTDAYISPVCVQIDSKHGRMTVTERIVFDDVTPEIERVEPDLKLNFGLAMYQRGCGLYAIELWSR